MPWTGIVKAYTILSKGGKWGQDVPTLPKKQRGQENHPSPQKIVQYKAQPEAGSPVAHTAFHELQQHYRLKPLGEELQ